MKSTHNRFLATLLFCLPLVSSAEWSIGMYVGNSPLDVSPPAGITNPVLTSDDVTDASASFVADPFMLFKDGSWHMFFEVLVDNGDIGYASSLDGLNWTYHQIVINETFHMSYPYVFEWQGEVYMVPETSEANAIRLYKAAGFPTQWTFVGNMLIGEYRDSSLFRHDNKWWLFTTEGVDRHDTLQLFYADALLGPWQAHPLSPVIVNDPNIARPGGRVTVFDGRLIRYTQDTFPTYGNKLRAFEITELTTTTYTEIPVVENPILDADGLGWNAVGMHHIDPHQLPDTIWLAVVDGNGDPDQLDFYGLWLSNASDRSNSRLLDGEALVQGDQICVYLLPEVDVDQVAFSLDGSLQQVEGRPPYDFAGTGPGGSCNLYDTLGLTLGEHTLSAEITHLDSSTTRVTITVSVVDAASSLVMDNEGSGTSSSGTWKVSGGADPYGTDSLYSSEAGASYTFSIDLITPGEYQVFAWWTEWGNRRTSVPYDITELGGTGTVTVNQQLNGGQWNLLGSTWNFGATATITIRSLGDGTTSADAIMLVPTGANVPPVLIPIGDQSVSAGNTLSFMVSATDSDGTIPLLSATGLPPNASFVDNSNGTGDFSWPTMFSDTGSYSITFIATDASDAALTSRETITVSVVDASSPLILDNGEAGTSSSGTWKVSGGADPYGADSLFSSEAGASYTFSIDLITPGEYQVFAWWTEWGNRRTSVPYDITELGGTGTVTVNQQLNGGQWNLLGSTWNFGATATITIRSLGDGTTSADAIMLVPTGANVPPVLIPIGDQSVSAGNTLSFMVSATDSDGTIPLLSATGLPPNASFVDNSNGTGDFSWPTMFSDTGSYSITFIATDASDAALTSRETITVSVVDASSPLILDNGEAGTSSSGTWKVSGGADPYGADSLFSSEAGASYTFSIDLITPGEYQVFAWWTEWRNRRTSVPYDITELGGTGTVTVNQQLNGGQWNLLGSTWNFGATATITIRSLGDGTTSADAIMLVPVSN